MRISTEERALLTSLSIVCSLSMIVSVVKPSDEVLLPAFGVATLLMFGLVIRSQSAILSLAGVTLTFVTLSLPTILVPTIHGYDTWIYLGSAFNIAAEGWTPTGFPNPNAHQFPGSQLIVVVISELLTVDIVTAAKYVTPLAKALLIPISYSIARQVSSSSRAAIAPAFLVGYVSFTNWMPFHHLTFGIIFKLLAAYLLLLIVASRLGVSPISKKRAAIVYGIVMMALAITHQFSIVQLGALLLAAIAIPLSLQALMILQGRSQKPFRGTVLGLVPLVGITAAVSISYFIYPANKFTTFAIWQQSIRATNSFAQSEPIAELQQVLTQVSSSGLGSSLAPTLLDLGILGFFSIAGVVALISIYYKKQLHHPESAFLLTIYGFAGVFVFLVLIDSVGLLNTGSTRRMVINALPFGVAAVLGTATINRSMATKLKPLILVLAAAWLVLSMAMYSPALLSDKPFEETEAKNKLHLSVEEQSAYEFAGNAENAIVSREGAYYMTATGIEVRARSSLRIYAGDESAVPSESLVIRRPWQLRSHPTYGAVARYRIPEPVYHSYDNRSTWDRIYTGGEVTYYQIH